MTTQNNPWLEKTILFTSGTGGYVRYRIPALVSGPHGELLAFCEARRFTGQDSDQIDLLMRRSLDGGRSFEPARLILSEDGWVCGNPAPVLDRQNGVIWLLFTKNRIVDTEARVCRGEGQRTVWVTHSPDGGVSWATPQEITTAVKPAGWAWYAIGPGHGIQLAGGRLLVACDHSLVNPDTSRPPVYCSHVIYSDDHGQNWKLGGSAPAGTNECMALETSAGQVMLSCRNAPGAPLQGAPAEGAPFARVFAWSEDGGESFPRWNLDAGLPEPICQASLCRVTDAAQNGRSRAVFVNPASRSRENLTVRLSYDDCQSWTAARQLHAGPAAYSDVCVAEDLTIACLYEGGVASPYETLTLARFNLAWVEK